MDVICFCIVYSNNYCPVILVGINAKKEVNMLSWAVVFLIIAVVAAFFGFGGIAGAATLVAKILFFIFVVLFLVSLVFGLQNRP